MNTHTHTHTPTHPYTHTPIHTHTPTTTHTTTMQQTRAHLHQVHVLMPPTTRGTLKRTHATNSRWDFDWGVGGGERFKVCRVWGVWNKFYFLHAMSTRRSAGWVVKCWQFTSCLRTMGNVTHTPGTLTHIHTHALTTQNTHTRTQSH